VSQDLVHVDLVCESVGEQLVNILTSESFRAWLGNERAKHGDLIILNNSFLHRDGIASRSKSVKYLCVTVEPDGQPSLDISVAISKSRINNRFKRVAPTRIGDYAPRPLRTAVEEELRELGTIVFAVAGRIGNDIPVGVDFPDTAGVTSFRYVPSQKELLIIIRDTLSINRLDDIDIVWRAVVSGMNEIGITDTSQLSGHFEKSFEELREEAARPVYINEVDKGSPSILTEIIARLSEQVDRYKYALESYVNNSRDKDAMNELLRIAYNFSDGASALVTLVVRISDIKPLLCWLTMTAQSALTDRFGELPFSLVGKAKPSLGQYRALVAGARNREFHDIFAFGQPFQIALTGEAFKDAELRLFQEYAKRSKPGLEYRDRELVELLSGFTRTAERPVPLGFWESNLDVMDAVLDVARSLHRALLLVAPPVAPKT
jgi:hypothetical protein